MDCYCSTTRKERKLQRSIKTNGPCPQTNPQDKAKADVLQHYEMREEATTVHQPLTLLPAC